MPRPKGSKNRKAISSSAKIAEQINAQKKVLETLNDDLEGINAAIKEQQLLAKGKKKEIRKVEKAITVLASQMEESKAIESAAAKKAEIESVVEKLIKSGKSAKEILSRLD